MEFTEPAVLLNIAQFFQPGMSDDELYEVTRCAWKAAPESHSPHYALAVYRNTIQQVYVIEDWQLSSQHSDRWCFAGHMAADKAEFVGKPIDGFPQGAANPVKYINC